MTDKLTVYNLALGKMKERKIATLAENREPRRVLDDYFTDVVNYCLERGLWLFAKRVVQIDSSSTLVPAFDWAYAFKIPNDWVRTFLVSTAPQLDPPLLQFAEETGYWYARQTPLYVSYVSSDPLYGWNLGAWPETFTEYVACRLANESAPRIVKSDKLLDRLERKEQQARRVSLANDAMNEGTTFPPVPTWVRARRGFLGPGSVWAGGDSSQN